MTYLIDRRVRQPQGRGANEVTLDDACRRTVMENGQAVEQEGNV
jgi:hypothetical protein